mmetsp:Transcript_10768/g.16370  ORF Transcript_10768/g.16370 Transcript_10768/m.16370 type:complete len:474 (+) Transcript_10768:52-1473(+)
MFNRTEVKTGIVHFGVGRFHRAHEALYIQDLLSQGCLEWGICGVCMLPNDSYVFESLRAQDCKYTLIERDNSGVKVKQVQSIIEILNGYLNPEDVFKKLVCPEVKLVTITVTEAGYFFDPSTKRLDTSNVNIQNDISNHSKPRTLYGYLARGLSLRQQMQESDSSVKPFTIQSCDNIQGNGDLTRSLLLEFCQLAYPSLVSWIEANVAFPNSMVDRITPAPTDSEMTYVREELRSEDRVPVTSESYRQWVIEDNYCNDKPDWPLVGVQLVESVKPYEKIKVRLLNGGHMAVGYAGHLAGFSRVDEVSSDPLFQSYLRAFFSEVEKTLLPVEGVDIRSYQDTLVDRFANPAIEDQILRLCKDGSAKIPGFIVPTLSELCESSQPSKCVSAVVASYMRFLTIACDSDNSTPLDDPEAEKLRSVVSNANGHASAFLADRTVFGNIVENVKVVEEIQACYDQICENGIQATLQALIA